MRRDKEAAERLRIDGGSYREISNAIGVPISTLSNWFSNEDWSAQVRQKLTAENVQVGTVRLRQLNKVRGEMLKNSYEEAKEEAEREFLSLKDNPLFIAGMMLYWGEGDKAGRDKVRLTNTDVEMIRLFTRFLREVLRVPEQKIRIQLLVYPDLDDLKTKEFWSSKTGLSADSFIKSTLIQGRHPTKRLGHGVCMVYVSSTYLKVKVLRWLDLFPRELIERKYCENIDRVADMV